tara:strand:- start:3996 stop:4379 length:384 start_codon:yes stop_codon:yes gene_type:complete
MANIQLQRGQQQQIDVTFKNSGGTVVDFSSGFTGELVIRQKENGQFITGTVIDTLISGISSPADATKDERITFQNVAPNISLLWDTTQASALPNVTQTVAGDLRITKNGQVIHHVNLIFDITPEIVA